MADLQCAFAMAASPLSVTCMYGLHKTQLLNSACSITIISDNQQTAPLLSSYVTYITAA